MDNYNALSKSAILTKLALDGYFIDLLTLNSFIKEWQIEAIYENEFGIEFFDNTSYLTILNNLKTKYNKTKSNQPETPKEIQKPEPETRLPEEKIQQKEESELNRAEIPAPAFEGINEPGISIDTLVEEAKNSNDTIESADAPKEVPVEKQANYKEQSEVEAKEMVSLEELAHSTANIKEEYEEKESVENNNNIMPEAMKNLTPGPVSPCSNINVDHSYIPEYNEVSKPENNILNKEEIGDNMEADTMEPSSKGKNLIEYDDELMQILSGEDFTAEEIEKADKLMTKKETAPSAKPAEEEVSTASKEEVSKKETTAEEKELDLIQLAQSFAQNLTGQKDEKEVPPADLEKIFEESYTEPFEELKDYVQDIKEEEAPVEEYKSLQEALPSDIEALNGQTISAIPVNPASVQGISSYSNLTADNIREIIREEISRQTRNTPQIPNNDSIKNLVREIVKQTADVAPQNAFKLDISNRTLDLIAKAIAKKIAVKLNDYYKLNSSKQNAKLQMFRDKTIELKEKNQALNDENKKLRMLLLESNKNLNSYKPTIFGLFKFEGKKRK